METHDPVKPFNCAQCGKSFMSQVALDNHERVHSGDKAIECKVGPVEKRSEKICLWGFQPGPTQTGLCSHRRW